MKRIKKKGFTLMELIIVIAIIGILAAVIYPSFISYTEKAKLTKAIQDAKVLILDIDSYNSEQEITSINEDTILSNSDFNTAIIGAEKAIRNLPSEFSNDLTISKIRSIADSKINELSYNRTTGKVNLK